MTVQAELNNPSHRIEWILCIEGIGWPANEASLSSGLDGRIFVTGDLDGTMDADLQGSDLTVAGGLEMPGAISDSLDPETLQYDAGGLSFDVVDIEEGNGGWLLNNVVPRAADSSATIETAIDFSDTTVRLNEPSKQYAEKDVIWVGGREAIALGTRSSIGGGVYSYASSTRGYLGTPIGRYDYYQVQGAFSWDVNTVVYSLCPYWLDRRVILFMHVPGEAPANLLRVYTGRIRGIQHKDVGATVWTFETIAETTGGLSRTFRGSRDWVVTDNWILRPVSGPGTTPSQPATPVSPYIDNIADETDVWSRRRMRIDYAGDPQAVGETYNKYALGYVYHYRTEPGGTEGVKTAIDADPDSPQARSDVSVDGSTGRDLISAVCNVDGVYVWLKYHDFARYSYTDTPVYNMVIAQGVLPMMGNNKTDHFENGVGVRFMLDNMGGGAKLNRFAVNGYVMRNVVDILLCFLTTMPGEYYRGDATGGSTTVVTFAGESWTTNQWVGYALHSVEKADIKGEARVITANNATQITVGTAFSVDTHTGANTEFQIRNSIYDVLPVPWGLRVHNSKIDISGIEAVRDAYLSDATVSRFALGDSDDFDLWELLERNICRPYGLLPYIDRTTGKFSLRYIGGAPTDGVTETYVTVAAQNIIEMGGQEVIPRAPIAQYEIRTQGLNEVVVRPIYDTAGGVAKQIVGYETQMGPNLVPTSGGGAMTEPVRLPMLDAAFDESMLGSRTYDAMFNHVLNMDALRTILYSRLWRTSQPAPEIELSLDVSYIPRVQAGQVLAVTDTGTHRPVNPYSAGSRGWSSALLRVLSTTIEPSGSMPGMRCRVQILNVEDSVLIAPAATVTAKNEPGGGSDDNFTVNINDWSFDDANDTDEFAVGDLVEVRSKTGAQKIGPLTITAVTSTQVDVAEDISAYSFAADDYLTFAPWTTATKTANMARYSFYGDTSNTLDSDTAKIYG